MEEYKELFIKFNEKSSEIIEELNNENYDKVNQLLSEREALLESIKAKNLSKKVFALMDELYNIQETETKIKSLLSENLFKVNGEIRKLQLTSRANNSYNKNFYDRNKIFSKKV